jgi:hypothetical protein
MDNTPIFEQLRVEFIEQGKYSGIMIGPPEPKKIFGLLENEQPAPNMDDTIVMEPVKIEAPKTMATFEDLAATVARIVAEGGLQQPSEEPQHVFPIRRNRNPPITSKISAIGSFSYFGRAA